MGLARNLVVAPTQLISLAITIVRALQPIFATLLRILLSKLQKCKFQRAERGETGDIHVKPLDLI
jgi:hypothetical protein